MHNQSDVGRNGWRWGKTVRLVMARDARRCQLRIPGICTIDATEVDHIHPRSLGGRDDLDNLRAVCHSCHLGRGLEGGNSSPPRRYSMGGTIVRDYTKRKPD